MAQTNVQNKIFIKILTFYMLFKIFSVLLAYFINREFLGNINFDFPDIGDHLGCTLRPINTLYSYTLCAFNINDIANYKVFVFAFILSSLKDVGYIYLSSKILKKNYLLFFVFLLSIHPYLAIYHPRFVTGLFASLGFLLIFWVIRNNLKLNSILVIIFIILTGFRNGLMPCFIAFIVLDCYKNRRELTLRKFLFYCISVFLIFLTIKVPKIDYAAIFMDESMYVFSWHNIINFLSLEYGVMSYILSLPIVFISHFVLLLGFREAVFTSGFAIFSDFSVGDVFQIVTFSMLFMFHFLGLIGLFRNEKLKDVRMLSLVAYFLPSMLFVAHMRYFVPMIPLAILGFVFLLMEINKKIRKVSNPR